MDKSPLPQPKFRPGEISPSQELQYLNFGQAMQEVLAGARVSKKEWNSNEYYGFLLNGILKLHKIDGRDYDWILSDGDIAGEDYFVI